MSNEELEDRTRHYFERVMDDWQEGMAAPEHPYEANQSWQKRYDALKKWAEDLELAPKRVLEVGCGTGLLQDVVEYYYGVDIALSSMRYMYKPFAVCSATDLPFNDNTFDGVWSFWVLEHVIDPEAMLAEMRRVTKPGGSVFLVAAYAVDSWISQGIHKRPFPDLTPRQRLTKLTVPIRASIPYKVMTNFPRRLWELGRYLRQKQATSLRYDHLQPNYKTYWDYDADACVSLDSFSVALYFQSRGDTPYFSNTIVRSIWQRSQPQAYLIHK